jgi:hypothetical protein
MANEMVHSFSRPAYCCVFIFFAGPYSFAAALVSCISTWLLPTAAARNAVVAVIGLISALAGSYHSHSLATLDRSALAFAGAAAALVCSAIVEKIYAIGARSGASKT